MTVNLKILGFIRDLPERKYTPIFSLLPGLVLNSYAIFGFKSPIIVTILLILGVFSMLLLHQRNKKGPNTINVILFIFLLLLLVHGWSLLAENMFRTNPQFCFNYIDLKHMDLEKEKLSFIKSSYEIFIRWAAILLGAATFAFRENFFALSDKQKNAVKKNAHLIWLVWVPLCASLWHGTRANEYVVQSLSIAWGQA